jgi:epoxyqueuosine reductase QueG
LPTDLQACPTGALEPIRVDVNLCMAYAAENLGKEDVPEDVRELERELTVRPAQNSYIECTICMDAYPIGR